MKPEIWGPHAWVFLHSVTLEYPENPTEQDKVNMVNFINSVGLVLPCQKCRNNFKSHLDKTPLTEEVIKCKTNLVKWMIDIHNCVNKMNNKPELSYEVCLRKLLKQYNDTKNITISIIILAIVFILIFVFIYLHSMFRK
jgi:hypothetical protein